MSALVRAQQGPITITDQGGFWIGVKRSNTPAGTLASNQMYVQYQIPAERRHEYPIVMVHGGGGQGTDFLHTPDGRQGWATWFLMQGYAVYVVDRPGHGRSPYFPETLGPMAPPMSYEMARSLFAEPDPATAFWPRAGMATQWPATGEEREACLDQTLAAQGPLIADMAHTHTLMQECGAALLDRIGPAILMTHSMGAPFGWLTADARPGLVKAIVAIEPLAPAFGELAPGMGLLRWGLTAAPMTFAPPVSAANELKIAVHPPARPDTAPANLQAEPARKWPNLSHIPTLVVTGEASFMTLFDPGTVAFLKQVGVPVSHMRLEEHGEHGNGHLMMAEKNSDAIAALIDNWLTSDMPTFQA